jgi:hypothetical protein
MWRNGYAPVCKTVYSGSIPDVASINSINHLSLQATPSRGFPRGSASPWQDRRHGRTMLPSGSGGTMKIQVLVVTLSLLSPAWAQSKPPIAVRADPCAPIGRTADGQLVYSMKCDRLPVPVAAPRSEAANPAPAPVEDRDEGGLFRNPFPSIIKPSNVERSPGVGPSPGGR